MIYEEKIKKQNAWEEAVNVARFQGAARRVSARAGRRIRPQVRDVLKKIPKKRGYRFTSFRVRPDVVNVEVLERVFSAGETISPLTLTEKNVLAKKSGVYPSVKILGNGAVTKKFKVEGCEVSASAKVKLEKAGGIIQSM